VRAEAVYAAQLLCCCPAPPSQCQHFARQIRPS
jgi:hypothetical protein